MRRAAPTATRVAKGDVLLEVDHLQTWFQSPAGIVRAVDDVSLSLKSGETLGIVGESGSGKSVTVRSIMGLLPSQNVMRAGSIRFDGIDTGTASRDVLRKLWGDRIAMIFQDPMTSLNPVMRIGEQLTEGLREHHGISKQAATGRAVSLLTEVGIPEPERRLRQYPHELSGGMRQRVMIASALSCGPDLLLADEPTTALDVTVQSQLLDLLAVEQTERRMSMILVTHDLGVVAGRTDVVAVMYAGKIVETAPTTTLFANMQHRYTQALFQSIPKLTHDENHVRLKVIAGRPPDLVNVPTGCRFAPRCEHALEKCVTEEPTLVAVGRPDHLVACWNPVGESTGVPGNHPVEVSNAVGVGSSTAVDEQGVA